MLNMSNRRKALEQQVSSSSYLIVTAPTARILSTFNNDKSLTVFIALATSTNMLSPLMMMKKRGFKNGGKEEDE